MPLKKSGSDKAKSDNIRQLLRDGKPRKQAIAIALDIARRSRKATGGGVAYDKDMYEPSLAASSPMDPSGPVDTTDRSVRSLMDLHEPGQWREGIHEFEDREELGPQRQEPPVKLAMGDVIRPLIKAWKGATEAVKPAVKAPVAAPAAKAKAKAMTHHDLVAGDVAQAAFHANSPEQWDELKFLLKDNQNLLDADRLASSLRDLPDDKLFRVLGILEAPLANDIYNKMRYTPIEYRQGGPVGRALRTARQYAMGGSLPSYAYHPDEFLSDEEPTPASFLPKLLKGLGRYAEPHVPKQSLGELEPKAPEPTHGFRIIKRPYPRDYTSGRPKREHEAIDKAKQDLQSDLKYLENPDERRAARREYNDLFKSSRDYQRWVDEPVVVERGRPTPPEGPPRDKFDRIMQDRLRSMRDAEHMRRKPFGEREELETSEAFEAALERLRPTGKTARRPIGPEDYDTATDGRPLTPSAPVESAMRNYWEANPQQQPWQFVPEQSIFEADALRGKAPYKKEGPFEPGQMSPPGSILPKDAPVDRIGRALKRHPDWEPMLNKDDAMLHPPKPQFDPELNPVIPGSKTYHNIDEAPIKEAPEGILHKPQATSTQRPIFGHGKKADTFSPRDEWSTPRPDPELTPMTTLSQLNDAANKARRQRKSFLRDMREQYPDLAQQIRKKPEIADLLRELKQEQFKESVTGKKAAPKAGIGHNQGPIIDDPSQKAFPSRPPSGTVRVYYGVGSKGEPGAGSVFTPNRKEAEKYGSGGLRYVDVPSDHPLAKKKGKLTKDLIGQVQKFANGGRAMGRALATAKKYASGGPLDMSRMGDPDRHTPHPGGLFKSSVPGRTDKLPIAVKPGSYVIPADILSSTKLGEGNTLAGAKVMDKMLEPHRRRGGSYRPPSPHFSPTKSPKRPKLADGGETDKIPIIVAGGEYLIEPEEVASIGGGDLNKGHNTLDSFVKDVRSHNIKTLRKLPGPKRN